MGGARHRDAASGKVKYARGQGPWSSLDVTWTNWETSLLDGRLVLRQQVRQLARRPRVLVIGQIVLPHRGDDLDRVEAGHSSSEDVAHRQAES